jgi:hypothetical protein
MALVTIGSLYVSGYQVLDISEALAANVSDRIVLPYQVQRAILTEQLTHRLAASVVVGHDMVAFASYWPQVASGSLQQVAVQNTSFMTDVSASTLETARTAQAPLFSERYFEMVAQRLSFASCLKAATCDVSQADIRQVYDLTWDFSSESTYGADVIQYGGVRSYMYSDSESDLELDADVLQATARALLTDPKYSSWRSDFRTLHSEFNTTASVELSDAGDELLNDLYGFTSLLLALGVAAFVLCGVAACFYPTVRASGIRAYRLAVLCGITAMALASATSITSSVLMLLTQTRFSIAVEEADQLSGVLHHHALAIRDFADHLLDYALSGSLTFARDANASVSQIQESIDAYATLVAGLVNSDLIDQELGDAASDARDQLVAFLHKTQLLTICGHGHQVYASNLLAADMAITAGYCGTAIGGSASNVSLPAEAYDYDISVESSYFDDLITYGYAAGEMYTTAAYDVAVLEPVEQLSLVDGILFGARYADLALAGSAAAEALLVSIMNRASEVSDTFTDRLQLCERLIVIAIGNGGALFLILLSYPFIAVASDPGLFVASELGLSDRASGGLSPRWPGPKSPVSIPKVNSRLITTVAALVTTFLLFLFLAIFVLDSVTALPDTAQALDLAGQRHALMHRTVYTMIKAAADPARTQGYNYALQDTAASLRTIENSLLLVAEPLVSLNAELHSLELLEVCIASDSLCTELDYFMGLVANSAAAEYDTTQSGIMSEFECRVWSGVNHLASHGLHAAVMDMISAAEDFLDRDSLEVTRLTYEAVLLVQSHGPLDDGLGAATELYANYANEQISTAQDLLKVFCVIGVVLLVSIYFAAFVPLVKAMARADTAMMLMLLHFSEPTLEAVVASVDALSRRVDSRSEGFVSSVF